MHVRSQRWVIVAVVVAVALACTSWRVACVAQSKARDELVASELARIRSEGYPATVEELDAWYASPPPGRQNAADVYEEAFAALSPQYDWESVPVLEGEIAGGSPADELTEPTRRHALECLDRNRESLRLLHAASTIEHCRYSISLSEAWAQEAGPPRDEGGPKPPHLKHVWYAWRLLLLETNSRLKTGSHAEAVRSFASSMSLSNSLAQEPLWASQVTRMAFQRVDAGRLEPFLSQGVLSKADLRLLAAAFGRAQSPESWLRAAVGERCLGIRHYRSMGRSAYQKYLKHVNAHVVVWETPFPDRLDAQEAVSRDMRDLPSWSALQRRHAFAPDHVSGIAAHDASIGSASVALAIEQYRLDTDALPGDLSELVPDYLAAIPTDPYDGLPLKYKKTSPGYIVYSVGWNREDNGGDEDDIEFIVPR